MTYKIERRCSKCLTILEEGDTCSNPKCTRNSHYKSKINKTNSKTRNS